MQPSRLSVSLATLLLLAATACDRKPPQAGAEDDDSARRSARWGDVPVLAPDLDPADPPVDGNQGDDGNGGDDEGQGDGRAPGNAENPQGQVSGHTKPQATCSSRVIDRSKRRVDVIVAIGGYNSASREIPWISLQLSATHRALQNAGLDPRIVLIGGPDLCVYPPLGDSFCGETADYRHLPLWIAPDQLLDTLFATHDDYSAALRPDSDRVLVWLSDAWSSSTPTGEFAQLAEDLRQLLGRDLLLTSLVSQLDSIEEPCRLPHDEGERQLPVELAEQLGGHSRSSCGRVKQDIDDLFDRTVELILESPALRCTFEHPDDGTLDLAHSEVRITSDGHPRALVRVDSETACAADGYHTNEQGITLCPELCRHTASSAARIDLRYGCDDEQLR